jgi:hypothetical protein
MPDLDALNRRLLGYLDGREKRFHVETLYAYQLGPVTAAVAAHGTSNQWQGVPVIPLTNADEIHAAVMVPYGADLIHPQYLRWLLLPDNADSSLTITTTVDTVDMSRDLTGSDAAGDGGTALDVTIPAIVAAETTAETPFGSDWGKINGKLRSSTFYDCLFVKGVASGQAGADRLRVFGLQVAFRNRKYAGRR